MGHTTLSIENHNLSSKGENELRRQVEWVSDYERGKSTIYGCWISVKLIEIQQKDDLFPTGIISPGLGAALSWLGHNAENWAVMRRGENWGLTGGSCA